jgi:hypothetical protein
MKNAINCIACFSLLVLVFSCKPNQKELSTGKPLSLESRSIQQKKGTDCDKQPDSLRTDCAIIDFSVPKIKGAEASAMLHKNMEAWTDKFLIHLLIWSDYPETDPTKALTTLDAAIKRFHAIHDEAEGSISSGQFLAACTYSVLLNDGKYLTLLLDGHSFVGGNRPLNEVGIASFEVKTGKQLTWDDLVKDKAALLPIAQAKVRETRADVFKEGFEFDKTEQFALPSSFGLTADGLLLHYQSDEIYQLGGATEFTIPYSELGANLKVATPAPPADETTDAGADFYEVVGDSLVIPTFEIEVTNSPAADRTLAKKKETIIVSAMFTGVPSDPKEQEKGEEGLISFGNHDIELTGKNRIARFEGLKFHKNLLGKVSDKDISLLINIYSGRKSSQDNLLDCGILDMKASKLENKRFVMGCKLIAEPAKGGEVGVSGYPLACYALPDAGEAAQPSLSLLVECDESGNIEWAGQPMKDYDALMAALRTVLAEQLKNGAKELPGLETRGCLMGNSGEIRTRYDELKTALLADGKSAAKPTEMEKPDEKITAKSRGSKPAPSANKPAAATKSATPAITLNEKGEITLDGKKVSMENLRKELQTALLSQAVIPNEIALKTIGQTGMGMRAEVNTTISEAISGAKWVRKKAAIAALNSSVGKKLAVSTQLELNSYQTNGDFVYISAKPKLADGGAIDYSKTVYAKDALTKSFADNTIGLLQYEKGVWKVLTYSIGVSKAPADVWVKNYKAPKALFGK